MAVSKVIAVAALVAGANAWAGGEPDSRCGPIWDQCGGVGWSKCCEAGLTCVWKDKYYAQCKPNSGCSPAWGQCGGLNWNGSKCCSGDYSCVPEPSNPWYSQCKPNNAPTCAALWGQCGGEGFKGPNCCYGDATCVPQPGNKWYSQCLPPTKVTTCAKLYGQCGGQGWKGAQCCESGSVCIPQANNIWYSQCLPAGPAPTPTPTPDKCSPIWGQCGGLFWEGSKCCASGLSCVPQANNPYYSQCLPTPPTPAPTPGDKTPAPTPVPTCSGIWDQCGGLLWKGPTCCSNGTVCVPQLNNPWYSQCLPGDAAQAKDFAVSFIVVGENASEVDKLQIREGIAKLAGVDVSQVFIVSVINGIPATSRRRLATGPISSCEVFTEVQGTFIDMDAVATPTLGSAVGYSIIQPVCPGTALPDPEGACFCPGSPPTPVPASGTCVVYGA